MDDSRRFRSIHGDICPTCSTPHFPFCPPPPSLPLPSFNPHHAVEALRRFPPPTFNSHPAPLPPPQSFPLPPAAPLPELWTADLPSRHRFPHEELLERENYRKRVRVDEPPSLSHFPPPQPLSRFDPPSSTWISSEDERRLSLIRNHGPSGAAQRYGDCNFQAPALGPASTNSQLLPQYEVGYHTQPPQANQYDGYRDFVMGPGLHSIEKIAHQESTDLGRGQFDKPDWFAPQERREIWRGEFDTVERFATQERRDFQRQGFNGTERFLPQERMYIQRGEFTAMDRPTPQDGRDGPRGEFDTAERFMSHERTGAQIGEFHNSERFTLQERRGFQREEPGTGDWFVPQETRDFRRGDFDSGRGGVSDGQIKDQLYGRYCQHESLQQLPKSYSHGQSFERPMSYDDQPSEEWPFRNPTPQASCPADYAPQDPYKNYYTQDHQVVQLNESSSSVAPRPAQYAQLDGNMLPSNVMNCEQQSSYPSHATEYPRESKLETHGQHANSMGTSSEYMPPFREDIHKPFDPQAYPIAQQPCDMSSSRVRSYLPASQPIDPPIYPPLPPQPTAQIYPPLPPEPLVEEYAKPPAPDPQNAPSLPEVPPMLVPAPPSTSTTMPPPPPPNAHGFSEPSFSEPHPSPEANFYKRSNAHASTPFTSEMQGLPLKHQAPSIKIPDEEEPLLPFKYPIEDKSTVIDACHLFKKPYRALRPDHVVIILRGLPGSGKSYLAKALRDIEVENGGGAPRIHAMDDYFMIEVEKKLEDSDGTKSSTSVRGKKTKKVIEYCYEPEMEEAYRSSMLKAFKKTLDEGVFTFVIVDDRNLRVADFAQFWAIAKRSGYEVYLLEAKYKDPAGCAARNVHGFNLDDIQKMSEQWEEASSLYLQLDIQSLFHGDDLNEHSIKEVDMDTDDPACDDGDMRRSQDGDRLQFSDSVSINYELDDGVVKIGDRWDTEEAEEPTRVKELKRSKWSKDFDDADNKAANEKPNSNALSGLIQAYGKSEKSVHWGDQVDKSGFSIGAVKKKNVSSIIIGPGSGYNLISNPLVEDMEASGRGNINESKSRFNEQLRAESESFKEVFDRRRQRIGGMFSTEDE